MNIERKEYMRAYQRAWLDKRRCRWIKDHGPCAHCGSLRNLEVDHVDPSEKEFQPSALWSLKAVRRDAELQKCQVLCRTCHRKKHQAPHGMPRRYNSGCRCELCREANRKKIEAYRARREVREPGFRNKRNTLA